LQVPEITRRPAFWVVFAALSAFCAVLAWRYFPDALPLINLDVRMSRAQALEQGAALGDKLGLAPAGARAAVQFARDADTQNYVELEAGGNARFSELLSGSLYSPYWWDVRLFKPRETAEARIRFRPDGTPYGFVLQVPETQPGPALDSEAARSLGEERARADWGVDFSAWTLLERSQQTQPNGRVDHAFVYERARETLGDARFRMTLTVAGDRLSGLLNYVHVPEAFGRRFQELRAANNNIAQVASLVAGLLYGIGGCVLGALWLTRKRALLWRPAFMAGTIVAGLNAAALLANAPQAWFGFDTAQSEWIFWGQQIGAALLVTVGGTLGLALVFMTAEGLSRLAFADHPQFWRLWSRAAAPTPAVLGRTLGGYLFVAVELALIVGFYYVTDRYLGWWQPSESLSDPNILGSALPGLAPIGTALQAGFMEECLFRAIPLSLAALIGARFGVRRVAIACTLVLQAVVFGAAHANYPGFPAYSRPVELFVPALIWGLIFLRFGLLPTVILHAVFDLVLMSMPVFLIAGAVAHFNQALVIGAALIPLAIVLARRVQAGAWRELPASLRNGIWQHRMAEGAAGPADARAAAGRWTMRVQQALPVLAAIGLLAFVAAGDFHSDAPPLTIDRARAEAVADQSLKARGIELGPEWKRMSSTRYVSHESGIWLWHKFVWREAGADVYAKLIGRWLAPPMWEVRYARFDVGDVADRVEEWTVTVDGAGNLRQVRHVLPEARPGASLSQEDARKIAQQGLARFLGLDAGAMREVSAEQGQRPARVDWQFIWADPRVDVGAGGEARAVIGIGGDEVVSYGRAIFVPEEWQRSERARLARLRLIRMAIALTAVVAGVAALIASIIAWSRGRFDRRAFAISFIALAAALALGAANLWPVTQMSFDTTEPYRWQALLSVAGTAVSLLLLTLVLALLAGVAAWAARSYAPDGGDASRLLLRGLAAGAFVAGTNALIGVAAVRDLPRWPTGTDISAWSPWLAAITGTIVPVIGGIAVSVMILFWLDRLTDGWHRRRGWAFVLLAGVAGAQAAMSVDNPLAIIAIALVVGALDTLLFAAVLRFDLRVVPGFVAAQLIATVVTDALLQQTRASLAMGALSCAMMVAMTWGATRYLIRAGPAAAHARAPA